MSRNYSSTAVDTTLSGAVTAADTAIPVAATTGFPAAPFVLALSAGAATQELVLVTAVSGLTLTATRGYDSTVTTSHAAGAVASHSHAAIDFREAGATKDAYDTHAAAAAAHGATGAVVGTTNIQVLTNKDLTSTTNALPTLYPRGILGYAQVTANQAGITTEVDVTGLSVAVTVGTSRRIRISYLGALSSNVAGDSASAWIKEGTTTLDRRSVYLPTIGTFVTPASVILTPTAGAHTYKITAARIGGTGNISHLATDASGVGPAFILVEDIGAA